MLEKWMETNQSNKNKQHQKHTQEKASNMTRYNFQEKHIFTFILDVKLFAVDTTGIASSDGDL